MGATEQYVVVRNHEEQYSVWAATSPPPAGWESVGEPASREDCLAEIERVWTDMRPASLRRAMAEPR
jgi:MbtH protein